jgi:hypothetical protein
MAAEDTGDVASIALLHRLRAGATVHFVHHVDVCSAAPEDLVADLEPAPGASVWYLYCVKKYKSTHGRPGGHRQRAVAASDTCWHSEGSAKDVDGGGTVCNLSYGRKDGRSFSRLGWCMMEYDDAATGGGDYVLCKVYRSPRAQVKPKPKPTSSASKTAKRKKSGGEHPEARPPKLFHGQQDAFFTNNDYAMPSTAAQVDLIRGGEEEHPIPSTQDGEFVETSYGLLPLDVAQLNVEEWIGGMEMSGGEEAEQSGKTEQEDGSVKVAPLVSEDITVEDYLLAPEMTTSGEASGMPLPATFTPVNMDAVVWGSLQQEQSLQMEQPHATESDPMAEAARTDLETPYAAAMALACQLQESDWMMRNFLQTYHFQLPCLMC